MHSLQKAGDALSWYSVLEHYCYQLSKTVGEVSVNGQLSNSTNYKVYPRNSLDLVAISLKFATILQLRDEAIIATFQGLIRSEFPEYSRQTGTTVEFTPDGFSETKEDQHHFSSKDKSYNLVLGKDQLSLQTTNHENRQLTLGKFSVALDSLRSLPIGLIDPERYGIRYINNIDKEKISNDLGGSIVRWSDLVENEYLKIPEQQAGDNDTRYYCEVNSAMAEGRLIVRYGLLPAQRAEAPKVNFRFDCDRYTDGDIDLDKLNLLSDKFTSDIYDAFSKVKGATLNVWMDKIQHSEVAL